MNPPSLAASLVPESVAEEARRFFDRLYAQGGPEPADFGPLRSLLDRIAAARLRGDLAPAEITSILVQGGDATVSPRTLQGFAWIRPHGVPTDFELLERIYSLWISPDPALEKWDRFFQAQAAPRALRNRKDYFKRWLAVCEATRCGVLSSFHLLHLGGGPGREILEYFEGAPDSRAVCTCIDASPGGQAHAARVCSPVGYRVCHYPGEPLSLRTSPSPHLIWSAGFLDSAGDVDVAKFLARLWRLLPPGGEAVASGFSPANPSRDYMELGGWNLYHRDADHLASLALRAGVPPTCLQIHAEPEGVILFLHIEKPK